MRMKTALPVCDFVMARAPRRPSISLLVFFEEACLLASAPWQTIQFIRFLQHVAASLPSS